MKKIGIFLIVISILLLLSQLFKKPVPMPNKNGEVKTQEVDAAKASFLAKAEMEMQDLANKVKALEDQSKQSGAKTRAGLDKQVAETRLKLDAARLKVDELHASSSEAWKTLRQSVEEAIAKVKVDYQKSKTYFNRQDKTKTKST